MSTIELEELRPQIDVLLAHELVGVRPLVGGQLAELLHAVDLAEDVLDLALLRRASRGRGTAVAGDSWMETT